MTPTPYKYTSKRQTPLRSTKMWSCASSHPHITAPKYLESAVSIHPKKVDFERNIILQIPYLILQHNNSSMSIVCTLFNFGSYLLVKTQCQNFASMINQVSDESNIFMQMVYFIHYTPPNFNTSTHYIISFRLTVFPSFQCIP